MLKTVSTCASVITGLLQIAGHPQAAFSLLRAAAASACSGVRFAQGIMRAPALPRGPTRVQTADLARRH